MKPSDDVIARRVDDQVVLVNLRTNKIYALNRTGARAWELLEEGRSRGEIAGALLEEFDVESDEVEAELDGLFAHLGGEGLVSDAGH
jgi:Coenzyme PQQ synthesis protein D (PqqD)